MEWVQMTSQQWGTSGSHREEQSTVVHDQSPDRTSVNQDEGQPEHIRRDMLRLRGRQALIDLLVRVERERQGELHGLTEYRAVSDFAHRNRIQSLLRGRFLRNERHVEEERLPSMAASELVQLRQRHTVSGLRYILTISLGIIFYFPVICSILLDGYPTDIRLKVVTVSCNYPYTVLKLVVDMRRRMKIVVSKSQVMLLSVQNAKQILI